jgi:hypothetical protein
LAATLNNVTILSIRALTIDPVAHFGNRVWQSNEIDTADASLVIGRSSCDSYLLEAVVDRDKRDERECQPRAHKRQANSH